MNSQEVRGGPIYSPGRHPERITAPPHQIKIKSRFLNAKL